jgi:hypothetical protein
MTGDALTDVLLALSNEDAAVRGFDEARDVVVDLIGVRADAEAVYGALDVLYERLESVRSAYYGLEQLFVAANLSMERPEELPRELREAFDAELPRHEEHLRQTAEAELVIGAWLEEQTWERGPQRYWTSRRLRESHHLKRRARHRRRGA